jgi:hypothetical protein
MCDVLGSDGEMVTRAIVQWVEFQAYREWLTTPQKFELELVAFAEEASFFSSEEEYEAFPGSWLNSGEQKEPPASGGVKAVRFASNVFIPTGSFAPEAGPISQRASAMFAGRVEESERIVNSITSEPFHRVRVNTLPGPIDTVLDPKHCKDEPAVGEIAFIQGWLVGRPMIPPPEKRGWFAKLLGK